MARHPALLALRIAAWRARWLGRVLLVAVAVVLVVHLTAPPPAGIPVVVTSRTVHGGDPLTTADLRVVRLPVGLVPSATHAGTGPLLGRAPAVDLPAGIPVVDGLLAGQRFTLPPPPGTVVVAVGLTAIDLLVVGDRVDLVAPGGSGGLATEVPGGEPVVLARAALVLDVRPATNASGGLLGGGADTGQRVVVAVSRDEGSRIAAVWDGAGLGAVLVG